MNNRVELTNYQTANSKTYLKKDGSIEIEIYDHQINNDEIMLASITDDAIGGTIGVNTPLSIIDTYISSSGTTTGEENKIKIGVERVNGTDVIHRALLKFDLPTIPTSYTLINATLNMIGYYDENYNQSNSNTMVAIHQIKNDWLTTPPNWDNMLNGYHESIENYFHTTRSGKKTENDIEVIDAKISQVDITDLVQRWYSNDSNYGLMLKAIDEIYDDNIKVGEYYSSDYPTPDESTPPQPRLILNFKNINGLEECLTYTSQNHELGSTHINNYNGNLTSLFNVANTVGGSFPASIYLVYNTADIISNNDYGYGLGVKPNLIQTIKEVTIDTLNVLQYLDEDGTIHYFYKNSDDNIYYDEDGLSLKVELVDSNYIMTDKNKNTNKFVNHNGTYYLEQITDTTNKSINIVYDTNNRITKVIDASNKEITITYEDNKITFVSPYKTTIVNLTNNQITSIEDLGDTTTITYNDNKLIEKIINSNGLYIKYEYINDLIYKVSKITEYGRNDSEGNYLEFTYNLKSTSIKDRKGHVNTYVFNNNSNTEVITSLDENQNLSNAYGKSSTYGERGTSSVNKITLDSSLVRHINNLIDDSSFESGNSLFSLSNEDIITDIIDNAHYGIKALKVTNNTLDNYIYLEKEVKKDNYYTFSAYIKNEIPFEISLSYDDVIKTVNISDINIEYNRCDVTIQYPSTAISKLKISIKPLALGVIYIDGLQLEEGEVANYYNMISNSNFNNGLSNYQIISTKRTGRQGSYSSIPQETPAVEIKQIDETTKALKLINSPMIDTTISKSFNVSGKAGDVYELSFWYKNEGPRVVDDEDTEVDPANIMANLIFEYVEGENDEPSIDQFLTPYNKDWHYFSKKFVAKYDYTKLSLNIINKYSCRDCYITNISLFKDLEDYSYTYDDEGNLIASTELSGEKSKFDYNEKNQLIEVTSPLGNRFKYEYDENVTNRLIRSISPSGITNSIDYDENNNPIKTVANNTQAFDEIINTTYYIRAKGTDRYIYIKPDKNLMVRDCECSHDKFNVIKQTENKIKLQYATLNNYYLKDNGGILKIEYGDTGNNIFELIEHSNKTYSIKSEISSLAITVDGDNSLSLNIYNEDNENQQFLFERMESKLFIEASALYTEDGRFIKSVKDNLGNVITYDIDTVTGVTKAITDPYGNITNYTYDGKFRTTNISKGAHSVSYEYDENDNLSQITHGTKNYSFDYNEYNNRTKVSINNSTLLENIYENNNGNLIKTKYGNGNEIGYTYDEYDRKKIITKGDNQYENYYDNLGRITKITSNNEIHKYDYDFAQRLSKFETNGFKTTLNYDKDNNVTTKIQKFNDKTYVYNYEYNTESVLTNLNIENINFNYMYDKLGRTTELSINNRYKFKYNYITNGNKTSTLIDKVDDNGIIYHYKYDKLGNLIEIKKENIVILKYYYDEFSQLIREDDFANNKTINYSYDTNGNMLFNRTYEYGTYNVIDENLYYYENSNWQDQVTRFNNEVITYDEIGNPTAIGGKQLSWKNGKELATYNDGINNIVFKYNIDGIRTEKIVNGIPTKYYLEGSKIVFEDKNGSMIYYIYSGDQLLGFKYCDNIYYYHKNIFDDIVGIMDNNYNEIVTYEYDSWGKITNVIDNSNIGLGIINPFRYRSYYYDEETNFYYINRRYYNSSLRRFINADDFITGQGILACNIYIYCGNNPNNRIENGNFWLTLGMMAACAAISAGAKVVENIATGEKPGKGVLAAGFTGFLAGAFAAPAVSLTLVETVLVQVSLGVIEATINTLQYNQSLDQYYDEMLVNSVVNLTSEFAGNDFIDVNEKWFRPQSPKGLLKSSYAKKVAINQTVNATAVTTYHIIQKNYSKPINTKKVQQTQKQYKTTVENFFKSQNKSYYSPYSKKVRIVYNDPVAKVCRVVFF